MESKKKTSGSGREKARKSTATPTNSKQSIAAHRLRQRKKDRFNEFDRLAQKDEEIIRQRANSYGHLGPQGIGIGKGGMRKIMKAMPKTTPIWKPRVVHNIKVIERSGNGCGKGNNAIPMAPFARLVKKINLSVGKEKNYHCQWNMRALHELRNIVEDYIISIFEHCNLLSSHSNRVTVMTKDMALCKRLQAIIAAPRGTNEISNS